MNEEHKLNQAVLNACFAEMLLIVKRFIIDEYEKESLAAVVYLMGSQIVGWAYANKVNLEQFMQATFDDIGEAVERLERERCSRQS